MSDSISFGEVEKFLLQNTLTAAKNPYAFLPSSFYVRILVPSAFRRALENPKQLTLRILKFGIAEVISSRDSGYVYDNGYMAFSFQCDRRIDAIIVENIIKAEYSDITVLNSLEYVDAVDLAKRLDYEYDETSYDSYVALARKLFVHMVETIKVVFPTKYSGHGGDFPLAPFLMAP